MAVTNILYFVAIWTYKYGKCELLFVHLLCNVFMLDKKYLQEQEYVCDKNIRSDRKTREDMNFRYFKLHS